MTGLWHHTDGGAHVDTHGLSQPFEPMHTPACSDEEMDAAEAAPWVGLLIALALALGAAGLLASWAGAL